ncbi:hypothetical protein Ciccas_000898 [Cichlidogyrus casuarinus]|uniref:DUF908 domain-containing protein n=1 Tax=Cichlidogyrus casuarinus TaxID=1844966 RepID=A0ABD2QLM2_9PLAT
MKIDRTKIVNRCGYDQVDCLNLATKLSNCSDEELLSSLRQIKVWNYGKCELGLWADVLNRFDDILDRAVTRVGKWEMELDLPGNEKMVSDVVAILDFTAHLIEHSIYRYLYGSWNHVLSLFTSSSLDVLLAVLGLAYNFSKRSNYFARQDYAVRKTFLERLYSVAETWGGDENGFGLASCCSGEYFPPSAGDVLFEYRTQASEGVITSREVSLKNVHQMEKSPSAIMEQVLIEHRMLKSKQMALFSRIRLAHYFSNIEQRHKCIRARLQALSILCYTFEVDERFLYPALIGELVRVLSLPVSLYTDIKACVLRVMTALVNSTRLGIQWGALLETNGISNYHGPLPGNPYFTIST